MSKDDWFFPRGSLANEGWETVIRDIDGWRHTGLRVADLGDGDALELPADGVERIVIPLTGPAAVEFTPPGESAARRQELAGRGSVFEGPTDVLYLGAGTAARLTGRGRVAVAEGPDAEPRPWRYVAREEVPVELRGRGRNSRQVHNFGTPAALDASRFMVVEVITPSLNWSSFPPHKHDRDVPGVEAALEEVYYFESEPTHGSTPPAEADAFGLMRTYAADEERPIHVMREVRTGDVVLVPHGYHGPTVASPGYDLYMLNVMAGPAGTREWLLREDPAHRWIAETFADEPIDPRLPLGHA